MSKRDFDRKIEELEALRAVADTSSILEPLRTALKDRNNYLVSKAAALAGQLGLRVLVPELSAAFDRFLVDAVKSDPQCWAKNAIAQALKDLGHEHPAIFLRGAKHFQLEPVWGGRADSAAALRAVCALALAGCSMDRAVLLNQLVDLMADPEKVVRVDAARAIAQVSGLESALVLRLKALAGDREPEVTGQCFACLLELEPKDYLPFVANFLDAKDASTRLEAVAALGASREPESVEILKVCWRRHRDAEMRDAILLSLGASRQVAAMEFLLSVLDEGPPEEAATSLAALAASRFRDEVRDRVAAIVASHGDARLAAAFEKEFARRR